MRRQACSYSPELLIGRCCRGCRPRRLSSKEVVVQGGCRPKGLSSKGVVVQRGCRPRRLSSKGVVVQRGCRPKGLSSKEVVVQGGCRPKRLSSKGSLAEVAPSTTLMSMLLIVDVVDGVNVLGKYVDKTNLNTGGQPMLGGERKEEEWG
jgi:hypothetical protein